MILFADRNKKMKLKSDVRFISTKFANALHQRGHVAVPLQRKFGAPV